MTGSGQRFVRLDAALRSRRPWSTVLIPGILACRHQGREERYDLRCKERVPRSTVKSARNSPPDSAVSASPAVQSAQWVVFCLDSGRYALPLSAVNRIVRAVYVTPLPLAPDVVLGAIDVEGQVLPVFNMRRRFRLPERAIDPADHFLIARTIRGAVVLAIDSSQGIIDGPATPMTDAQRGGSNLGHIRGVIQLEDGLVLIQDLEQFLSPDEACTLDEAMRERGSDAS